MQWIYDMMLFRQLSERSKAGPLQQQDEKDLLIYSVLFMPMLWLHIRRQTKWCSFYGKNFVSESLPEKIQAEEKQAWEDKDYLYLYEDFVMTLQMSMGSTAV